MVYDAARGRVLLFGGNPGAPTATNDTWEWDGSTWTRRTPATSPPGRFLHAMAYDTARHRAVLFGGTGGNSIPTGDTWEYVDVRIIPSGTARPGTSVLLDLVASGDVGLASQVGTSFGTGPIPVDTRTLDLSPDGLLAVSLGGLWPSIFVGYRGVIDSHGKAQAAIHIPNVASLVGTQLHTAFATLESLAPSGFRSISATVFFVIAK
jgi:galactose oxidase-like protein